MITEVAARGLVLSGSCSIISFKGSEFQGVRVSRG